MQFHKRNVISVESSSSDSEIDDIETIKNLNHQNPFAKLKMIGKIQNKVKDFINKKNFT
jgi:hypothetical protein